MPTTSHELAILDGIYTALERIDGTGEYVNALCTVTAWNASPLQAGELPLAVVQDPSVRIAEAGSLLAEDYIMQTQVVVIAPAAGETQRDRVQGAMELWQDVRRALLYRTDGCWLGVSSPRGIYRLRLTDVVAQPEEVPEASAWYSVVRVIVETTVRVNYPAIGGA
jgi:hypothetical protein